MSKSKAEISALEFYREDIHKALGMQAHIVVKGPDGGKSYVREVRGQVKPMTLVIGPLAEEDVEIIKSYIQGQMLKLGTRPESSVLNAAQFALLRERPR